MHIGISVAHASWSPHRSGYEHRNPSARPDEYYFSRDVAEASRSLLVAAGYQVTVVEKDAKYRCQVCDNPPKCGHYAAALVEATRRVRDCDISLEVHVDYAAPGRSGAIALATDNQMSLDFARAWLEHFTAMTPISERGEGVYFGKKSREIFGGKWFLDHGAPASVILEAGCASSATDSAYLQTTGAVEACAEAICSAVFYIDKSVCA